MNYFTDIKSASFKVDEQFLNGNTFNYPLTGQQGAELFYDSYDELLEAWNIFSGKSSVKKIEVQASIAGTHVTYFEERIAEILSYTNESKGITPNKIVVLFK